MLLEWHIFYSTYSMIKECLQFKLRMDEFERLDAPHRDYICRLKLPDEHFRFVTFEQEDYRLGSVTCKLYNYSPDSVFFSVESPLAIEPAIDKLIELNPDVKWFWANINFFDQDESGHAMLTVELRLSQIPMRVSASGHLIFK